MSLFGSLMTSVSGLSAQAQATAVISNNIANANTTGFKRAEATFASMVTTECVSAHYASGSVQMNRFQRVDQQGQLVQTASNTDVAINGEGFFTVREFNDLDTPGDFQYTRNGQFFEDEEGVLMNTAGKVLYGWPMDPRDADPNMNDGEPQYTNFNADLSALVPVDVSLANGETRVTSEAAMGLNLDADELGNTTLLQDQADGLIPYAQDFVPDFSRSIRMYDSLGSAQDITYQFTKVYGPQAVSISGSANIENDDSLSQYGILNGDSFDLTVGANALETFTATDTSTIGDLMDFVNSYGTGNDANAFLNPEGQLVISAVGFTDTLTLANNVNNPLSDLGVTQGAFTPLSATLPPDNLNGTFPELVNSPTSPTSASYNPGGWWQVNVIGPSPTVPLAQGLINFNSDGSFNASQDANGNIDIELNDIDWGNFSELQSITTDIEGMTQYAGLFNVAYASQNGSALGLKTGLEIDKEGYVNARFSNGTLSRLYKLPVASFASSPQLQEVSGTAYVETAESGQVLLNQAGESESGNMSGATLEQSNVDLADEFSRLIVTQRAYSANTRVITTVDQMTEDLLRLR